MTSSDLPALLRDLSPLLHPGRYVYVSSPTLPPGVEPVVVVREDEGLTLVLPRHEADALDLPYDYVAAWITLQVHSSLAAVGLTAAVSRALTDVGISVNVVAGAFHDHLFVPHDRATDAIDVLNGLAGHK